jgi:hypothetical protein
MKPIGIIILLVLTGSALAVNAATLRNREITITCNDIKIIFEVADKAKWALRLVTDKKGTTYNCDVVSG